MESYIISPPYYPCPQGASGLSLRSLPFFVYVNDIGKDLPFSQNKFFLQIMLFICFSQNAIQKDLSTLVKLAKQWKMVLNVEKCQAVNFKDGLNRVSCDYKIANV